jgi:hypothetical protein
MIGQRSARCLALLAFLFAEPATATLPPLPPPQYGAYGPLTICEHNISIAVRTDEAIDIVDRVFRVINEDYVVAAAPMSLSDNAIAGAAASGKLEVLWPANAVPAYRYSGVIAPEERRELIYPRIGTRDDAIFYAVPTMAGQRRKPDSWRQMLIITSPSFDGTPSDKTILARFLMNVDENSSCIRPSDLAKDKSDYPGPGEYEDAGLVRSLNDPFYAGWYPPTPIKGPGYHCLGNIGFAIAAGESLRRPWKSHGLGASFLTRGVVTVRISGPAEPMRRTDPDDPSEHPAGLLHKSAVTFYPSRGVGPPYAPLGVREDGSWLVELGKASNSRLEISFPAGDKGRLGFALVERLEFVADDDPRCGTSPR